MVSVKTNLIGLNLSLEKLWVFYDRVHSNLVSVEILSTKEVR